MKKEWTKRLQEAKEGRAMVEKLMESNYRDIEEHLLEYLDGIDCIEDLADYLGQMKAVRKALRVVARACDMDIDNYSECLACLEMERPKRKKSE